jgi:hypothetical protein
VAQNERDGCPVSYLYNVRAYDRTGVELLGGYDKPGAIAMANEAYLGGQHADNQVVCVLVEREVSGGAWDAPTEPLPVSKRWVYALWSGKAHKAPGGTVVTPFETRAPRKIQALFERCEQPGKLPATL